MTFIYWLFGFSIFFVIAERLSPRHQQKIFRKGILTDLFYFVFNGHFVGWGLAIVAVPIISELNIFLQSIGLNNTFYSGVVASHSIWFQFITAFFLIDFLHWCIHNLLHRISWLWNIHKVHHSIKIMDWIGSLRFHWLEALLYKSISYPLLSFFGFNIEVLLLLAIVNTGIGHFNHANLQINIGYLKYFINNPTMHIWHHHRTQEGPLLCNFGVNLSLWDWLFGTAYLPDYPPRLIGFDGIESYPNTALSQILYPLPFWKYFSHTNSNTSANESNITFSGVSLIINFYKFTRYIL